jgi:phosphopantetheinyl transferase
MTLQNRLPARGQCNTDLGRPAREPGTHEDMMANRTVNRAADAGMLWGVASRPAPGGLDHDAVVSSALSPAEAALFRTFAPRRAEEWLAGRLVAKRLVRRLLGQSVRLRAIEILPDAVGAPRLRPCGGPIPTVSISHTARYAAAAVAGTGLVGVDVECVQMREPALARYFLCEAERPLLARDFGDEAVTLTALWALKEATLKAFRVGLSLPPTCVEARHDGELSIHLHPPLDARGRVDFARVESYDDHVLALVHVDPTPASAASPVCSR